MEAFALALLRRAETSEEIDLRLCFKRVQGFALRPELEAAVAPLCGRIQIVDRGSADLRRNIAAAQVVHAFNASPDVVAL